MLSGNNVSSCNSTSLECQRHNFARDSSITSHSSSDTCYMDRFAASTSGHGTPPLPADIARTTSGSTCFKRTLSHTHTPLKHRLQNVHELDDFHLLCMRHAERRMIDAQQLRTGREFCGNMIEPVNAAPGGSRGRASGVRHRGEHV